ncbi:MAG: hypothetical protein ACU836_18380 [Gammaproteobacteria bacterium]
MKIKKIRTMKKTAIAILVITVTFGGCATSQEKQAKQDLFNLTIPICSGTDDCNAKWEAAQLWVVHNAGWKIQTQSNVLIETYNADHGSTNIAVRVTKEPLGGGRYTLLVKVWCDNLIRCYPDTLDAAINFNHAINAVTP